MSLRLGFSSKLFSSDEGPFCRVSLSGLSEEIVMSISIFYLGIYTLNLTSSSIFTLPVSCDLVKVIFQNVVK